jgi:hypothetical protein
MQNLQLASSICGISKDVANSTSSLTGTVQALNLSARDSTDRNAHHIIDAINTNSQLTQSGVERTAATTQNGVERTSAVTQSSIERTAGNILAAEERIAGENRITTLQTNSDSREQWSNQTRDIINLVNSGSFETRLSLQTNFASLLAEQAKNKDFLSYQLAENKYEDLKNQHVVLSQLADVKTQNALLMAESKYEALKTQTMLSSQISDCCCELKTTINAVDAARIRDDLNRARIISELRGVYPQQPYGPYGGSIGGYGNLLGNSVVGGFGLSLGESIFNATRPVTTPIV